MISDPGTGVIHGCAGLAIRPVPKPALVHSSSRYPRPDPSKRVSPLPASSPADSAAKGCCRVCRETRDREPAPAPSLCCCCSGHVPPQQWLHAPAAEVGSYSPDSLPPHASRPAASSVMPAPARKLSCPEPGPLGPLLSPEAPWSRLMFLFPDSWVPVPQGPSPSTEAQKSNFFLFFSWIWE